MKVSKADLVLYLDLALNYGGCICVCDVHVCVTLKNVSKIED